MALTVEDGTGVTNAVAYSTEATATAYLTARGVVSAAWTALATSAREALLVRGADLLNDFRRHPFKGAEKVLGQTMAWPRTGIVFPQVLPLCNALYAVSMANGILYDATSNPLGNITSVALPGGLKVEFDPMGSDPDTNPGSTPLIRHPTVDGLLYPYVLLPRDAAIGSSGGVVFVPLTEVITDGVGNVVQTAALAPSYLV